MTAELRCGQETLRIPNERYETLRLTTCEGRVVVVDLWTAKMLTRITPNGGEEVVLNAQTPPFRVPGTSYTISHVPPNGK